MLGRGAGHHSLSRTGCICSHLFALNSLLIHITLQTFRVSQNVSNQPENSGNIMWRSAMTTPVARFPSAWIMSQASIRFPLPGAPVTLLIGDAPQCLFHQTAAVRSHLGFSVRSSNLQLLQCFSINHLIHKLTCIKYAKDGFIALKKKRKKRVSSYWRNIYFYLCHVF